MNRFVSPADVICAAQFSDGRQHDAQEFLGWLLDSIHEDLNRVKVKPYVEYPDDDEADLLDSAALAERYWECHQLRNQSVIVDLFHGLLRSKLSCHQCKSVRTKFEPFTCLELPLPLDQNLYVTVVFHWLDGTKVPVELGVCMETRRKSINDLKAAIAEKVGVDKKRFVLFTVDCSNVCQFFSTRRKLKDLADVAVMHGMEVSRAPEEADQPQTQGEEESPQKKRETGKRAKKKRKEETAEESVGGEERVGTEEKGEGEETLKTENKEERELIRQEEEEKEQEQVEVDDEGTAEVAPPSTSSLMGVEALRKENEDFVVVAAVNRYLRYNPEYVALPFEATLFGKPMAVALSVSGENVLERIYDHVGMVLGDCIISGEQKAGGNRWPFVLKHVSNSGMHCRICPWTSRCLGCELDDENLSRLSPKFTIALDWDRENLSNCYDSARAKLTRLHPSVLEMRRVRAQPLELGVCLDMFSEVEQLAKGDSW